MVNKNDKINDNVKLLKLKLDDIKDDYSNESNNKTIDHQSDLSKKENNVNNNSNLKINSNYKDPFNINISIVSDRSNKNNNYNYNSKSNYRNENLNEVHTD